MRRFATHEASMCLGLVTTIFTHLISWSVRSVFLRFSPSHIAVSYTVITQCSRKRRAPKRLWLCRTWSQSVFSTLSRLRTSYTVVHLSSRDQRSGGTANSMKNCGPLKIMICGFEWQKRRNLFICLGPLYDPATMPNKVPVAC